MTSMLGKVVIVTGAKTGIGTENARGLAMQGAMARAFASVASLFALEKRIDDAPAR